jgi:hypothetical protein
LLRIVVPSWRVTHSVDLSAKLGIEMTSSGCVRRGFEEIGDGRIPTTTVLAMSSEGPVVAMRHVEAAGGETPVGGEQIYYDNCTGRVIEGRIVVRQAIVFDQKTLAVKRHYYGWASSIAGSPYRQTWRRRQSRAPARVRATSPPLGPQRAFPTSWPS